MTRPRKVQWADSEVENQKTSEPEGHKKTLKSNSVTKKLVQVRNYNEYAETHAIEKNVQSSPVPRKTNKFDRNLSTVHEEEDDVSDNSEESD